MSGDKGPSGADLWETSVITPAISVSGGSGSAWVTKPTQPRAPELEGKGEEVSVGVRLLKRELARRRDSLRDDEKDLATVQRELSRIRERVRDRRGEVKELEKEIELLEQYARMRESGVAE